VLNDGSLNYYENDPVGHTEHGSTPSSEKVPGGHACGSVDDELDELEELEELEDDDDELCDELDELEELEELEDDDDELCDELDELEWELELDELEWELELDELNDELEDELEWELELELELEDVTGWQLTNTSTAPSLLEFPGAPTHSSGELSLLTSFRNSTLYPSSESGTTPYTE
jgi:hypothetical protein